MRLCEEWRVQLIRFSVGHMHVQHQLIQLSTEHRIVHVLDRTAKFVLLDREEFGMTD